MKQLRTVILTFILFLPFNSRAPTFDKTKSYRYYPLFMQQETTWAESVFQTLSNKEKIAQLFMVPAFSIKKDNRSYINGLIKKHKIGGLIFMQGTPDKQIRLINEYQKKSKIPLLISIDAEGGLGFRLKNTMSFPSQMTLGAIDDLVLIREIGKEIARQCKRVGVHVNFSPVADINNNINNPVIGYRSFGENREKVASKSTALALGMQSENIIAVGKHFPGHGDTHIDSHKALPLINYDYKRLDSVEFYPFKHLIKNGVSGIMTAHLNVPVLDSTMFVSSLSPNVINNLLREKLGFNGLVFTDALNMRGVADYFENGDVEVQAIKAGNDVLLFSSDVKKSIKKIQKAIKKGKITQREIDKKVLRILKAKEFVGLHKFKPIPLKDLHNDLYNRNFKLLNFRAIKDAICIAKNTNKLIPIKDIDTNKILSIGIGADRYSSFQDMMNKYAKVTSINISFDNTTPETFKKIKKTIAKFDIIIISIHHTRKKDLYGINEQVRSFIYEAAKSKKVILNYFGIPYGLSRLETLETIESIVVSYNNGSLYQKISAQVIFGGLGAKGKLPVTAHKDLVEGMGIITKPVRIGYTEPELVNLDPNKLRKIDWIVKNAITKEALPGARVLIARNGQIVFNRSYGYHTYSKKRLVKKSDIFDLASITKIAATLPCVMKLYEEKRVKLKNKLGDILPLMKNSNKKAITIKEILTHQSGLRSYIPYYEQVLDTTACRGKIYHRYKSPPFTIQVNKWLYLNNKFKYKKNILSTKKNSKFPVKVGKNLYVKRNFDYSILYNIRESKLLSKKYRYSDLGFILLQSIVESISGTSLDKYAKNNFYDKLGCKTLTFNPLQRFSKKKIVPASYDPVLRRDTIQGTVHDPIAALKNGISGHAGLFGNAEDLVKIMQMYLNRGEYGKHRYFKEKTINLFTAKVYKNSPNRRALGFDKPQLDTTLVSPVTEHVSAFSYGHSGFTGILTWIDPVYDLIYIFQSNRVHPNDWNTKIYKLDVRSNIHELIYKAITDKMSCEKKFERLKS